MNNLSDSYIPHDNSLQMYHTGRLLIKLNLKKSGAYLDIEMNKMPLLMTRNRNVLITFLAVVTLVTSWTVTLASYGMTRVTSRTPALALTLVTPHPWSTHLRTRRAYPAGVTVTTIYKQKTDIL